MKEKKRISKRLTTKKRETIRKRVIKQAREKRRDEKKREKRIDGLPYHLIKTEEEMDIVREIRRNAEVRQKLYEEKQHVMEKEGAKNDVSKRYMKEVHKLVEEADVILEVLDARDPVASRCPEIEKAVQEKGKKLVFVLNKIDLVDRDNWTAWLHSLKEHAPAIPFKASTQTQRSNIGQNEKTEHASESFGVKDLMSLLKNYTRGGVSITVGIVGCPNAGKSSLINSLKREKACEVKNTPGVTKTLQHLVLDKSIRLIDSPGVIYRNSNPISNALRSSTADVDIESIVSLIYQKLSGKTLALLYQIQEPATEEELLVRLALKWGKFSKGGVPDTRAASFMLLRELQIGKIRFFTPPPAGGPSSTEIELTLSKVSAQPGSQEGLEAVYEAMP
ncbi:nuclear GTP-binding protein [Nematocida sp. AWRm77]|nr:nuclear GTP-binding protein [Nematocida sp. AWRm77]